MGDAKSQALFNQLNRWDGILINSLLGIMFALQVGVVILMGGNHNHHSEWITVYPFAEQIKQSYEPKGDTVIQSDAWIGMNAIIMPGVTIGEEAVLLQDLS